MSNQYADVRLGSSRNAPPQYKERGAGVQRIVVIVKRTCWSDYVSRIDLNLLSFYLETLPMR